MSREAGSERQLATINESEALLSFLADNIIAPPGEKKSPLVASIAIAQTSSNLNSSTLAKVAFLASMFAKLLPMTLKISCSMVFTSWGFEGLGRSERWRHGGVGLRNRLAFSEKLEFGLELALLAAISDLLDQHLLSAM